MIESAPTQRLQGMTAYIKQNKNVTDFDAEAKGDKGCGFFNLVALMKSKKKKKKCREEKGSGTRIFI